MHTTFYFTQTNKIKQNHQPDMNQKDRIRQNIQYVIQKQLLEDIESKNVKKIQVKFIDQGIKSEFIEKECQITYPHQRKKLTVYSESKTIYKAQSQQLMKSYLQAQHSEQIETIKPNSSNYFGRSDILSPVQPTVLKQESNVNYQSLSKKLKRNTPHQNSGKRLNQGKIVCRSLNSHSNNNLHQPKTLREQKHTKSSHLLIQLENLRKPIQQITDDIIKIRKGLEIKINEKTFSSNDKLDHAILQTAKKLPQYSQVSFASPIKKSLNRFNSAVKRNLIKDFQKVQGKLAESSLFSEINPEEPKFKQTKPIQLKRQEKQAMKQLISRTQQKDRSQKSSFIVYSSAKDKLNHFYEESLARSQNNTSNKNCIY